jgi:hypothetical protein
MEDKSLSNVVMGSKPVQKVSIAVRDLYIALKEQFPDGFTYDTIMEVVIYAMRYVAMTFKQKSGAQKKKLVGDSLIMLLDNTDSGELEQFDSVLKTMVPTIIDTICDIEKTKTKINKGIKNSCIYCCY